MANAEFLVASANKVGDSDILMHLILYVAVWLGFCAHQMVNISNAKEASEKLFVIFFCGYYYCL